MENYNKIIESLTVRFERCHNVKVLKPVTITNYSDLYNTLVLINKGEFYLGKKHTPVPAGSIIFIPANRQVQMQNNRQPGIALTYDEYLAGGGILFEQNKGLPTRILDKDNYTYLHFEAKIFDTVSFFSSLDIPAFIIKDNAQLVSMISEIFHEIQTNEPGKERSIKLVTDRIVIEIIRHILRNRLFVEELATNSTYFKDPRLVSIFSYIKENLNGDLSNKALAKVAQMSEDYVGQYFKLMTGINPQDYIEYQRMEEAVNLLRTTTKSIKEISELVGYSGTAYFCRRFKMMFGIPAGKMRKRESLVENDAVMA